MTLDEFRKLLENKHDRIQDEITAAREQKNKAVDELIHRVSTTEERVATERLILIDWIISEANKIEITKPKMREFL